MWTDSGDEDDGDEKSTWIGDGDIAPLPSRVMRLQELAVPQVSKQLVDWGQTAAGGVLLLEEVSYESMDMVQQAVKICRRYVNPLPELMRQSVMVETRRQLAGKIRRREGRLQEMGLAHLATASVWQHFFRRLAKWPWMQKVFRYAKRAQDSLNWWLGGFLYKPVCSEEERQFLLQEYFFLSAFAAMLLLPTCNDLQVDGLPFHLQSLIARNLHMAPPSSLQRISFKRHRPLDEIETLLLDVQKACRGGAISAKMTARVLQAPLLQPLFMSELPSCPLFQVPPTPFRTMISLTTLSLVGCCTDDILSVVPEGCPYVRDIDASFSGNLVTDAGAAHLHRCRLYLSSIHLQETGVCGSAQAVLIRALPCLQEISCGSAGDSMLRKLACMEKLQPRKKPRTASGSRLMSFNIQRLSCSCESVESIQNLATLFPHLHVLRVHLPHRQCGSGPLLGPLLHLHHLRELEVHCGPFFAPGSIAPLLQVRGERLTSLSLELTPKEGLDLALGMAILQGCPSLKCLSLQEGMAAVQCCSGEGEDEGMQEKAAKGGSYPCWGATGCLRILKSRGLFLPELTSLTCKVHRPCVAVRLLLFSGSNLRSLTLQPAGDLPLQLHPQFLRTLITLAPVTSWPDSLQELEVDGGFLDIGFARYLLGALPKLRRLGFLPSWQLVTKKETRAFRAFVRNNYPKICVDEISDVDLDICRESSREADNYRLLHEDPSLSMHM